MRKAGHDRGEQQRGAWKEIRSGSGVGGGGPVIVSFDNLERKVW